VVSNINLYAGIGLLLLIPLEIVFLIVIYAIAKNRDKTPSKIVIPPQEKRSRYEWETYLRLKKDRMKLPKKQTSGILIVVGLLILTFGIIYSASGSVFDVFTDGNETTNQTIGLLNESASNQSINATTQTPINESMFAPTINRSLDLTFSLPRLNTTGLPGLSYVSGNKSYYLTIISSLAIIAALLAIFFYGVRRQKQMAVIKKAKKTADKLIKKTNKKQGKDLENWKEWIVPITIIFASIAVLILLVRFITPLTTAVTHILSFFQTYRTYIAIALVFIIITIIVLQKLSSKGKQKK